MREGIDCMKALIIYASLTGNTEEAAEILEEAFETLDIEVEVEESSFADPEDFLQADICLVGTYTYGTDADLPDEIVDFYEELEEVDLSGKVYGVFGSGDTFYEKFCQSVDDFADMFEKAGAKKGAEPVKFNLDPDEEAIEHLEQMAKDLVNAARG